MAYPIPTIPEEFHGKELSYLELCTYGLLRTDDNETCINSYIEKRGQECSLKSLGFTDNESYRFVQYLYPLADIIENRRKIILDASKAELPF